MHVSVALSRQQWSNTVKILPSDFSLGRQDCVGFMTVVLVGLVETIMTIFNIFIILGDGLTSGREHPLSSAGFAPRQRAAELRDI